MICTECGQVLLSGFCPNCDTLRNKKRDAFQEHRKYAMKDVQKTARRIFGNYGGSKIPRAAWVIAAGKPEYKSYLSGAKSGTPRSYSVLEEVAANAVTIVYVLHKIRLAYDRGDLQNVVSAMDRLEKRDNPTDDSVKVCDKRRQHNKKYFKYILLCLLGLLLGLLARYFL